VVRVMAARGMETIITAIRQHSKNRDVCRCAYKALFNLTLNSKENTRLMSSMGVGPVITHWWQEGSEPAEDDDSHDGSDKTGTESDGG
jgi:hypothetical protein